MNIKLKMIRWVFVHQIVILIMYKFIIFAVIICQKRTFVYIIFMKKILNLSILIKLYSRNFKNNNFKNNDLKNEKFFKFFVEIFNMSKIFKNIKQLYRNWKVNRTSDLEIKEEVNMNNFPNAISIETCSICLEELKHPENCAFKCVHVFHYDCVTEWLKIGQTCPLCRSKKLERRVVIEPVIVEPVIIEPPIQNNIVLREMPEYPDYPFIQDLTGMEYLEELYNERENLGQFMMARLRLCRKFKIAYEIIEYKYNNYGLNRVEMEIFQFLESMNSCTIACRELVRNHPENNKYQQALVMCEYYQRQQRSTKQMYDMEGLKYLICTIVQS